MAANYTGDSQKAVSTKYLYDTLSSFKQKADKVYGSKTKEHSHENNEALDLITQSTDGELLFDGSPVNAQSKEFADHIKSDSIHVTSENKAEWDAKYDKPADGIPESDIDSSLKKKIDNKVTKTDIIASGTTTIKSELIDQSEIDHAKLKNSGDYSHSDLDEHINNAFLHSVSSLGSIIYASEMFAESTLENLEINDDGGLQLVKKVSEEPYQYQTKGTITSQVMNTGIEDCPFASVLYYGKYNLMYHTIKIYIRTGSTPNVDSTNWEQEWTEIGFDHSIPNAPNQYCQMKVELLTSDKYSTPVMTQFVLYYGIDMDTELKEARGDFATLNDRLNSKMDKDKLPTSDSLGGILAETLTDSEDDLLFTSPVKVDETGKAFVKNYDDRISELEQVFTDEELREIVTSSIVDEPSYAWSTLLNMIGKIEISSKDAVSEENIQSVLENETAMTWLKNGIVDSTTFKEIANDYLAMSVIIESEELRELLYINSTQIEEVLGTSEVAREVMQNSSQYKESTIKALDNTHLSTTVYDGKALLLDVDVTSAYYSSFVVGEFIDDTNSISLSEVKNHTINKFVSAVKCSRDGTNSATATMKYFII